LPNAVSFRRTFQLRGGWLGGAIGPKVNQPAIGPAHNSGDLPVLKAEVSRDTGYSQPALARS
jgi:hypothetical protein